MIGEWMKRSALHFQSSMLIGLIHVCIHIYITRCHLLNLNWSWSIENRKHKRRFCQIMLNTTLLRISVYSLSCSWYWQDICNCLHRLWFVDCFQLCRSLSYSVVQQSVKISLEYSSMCSSLPLYETYSVDPHWLSHVPISTLALDFSCHPSLLSSFSLLFHKVLSFGPCCVSTVSKSCHHGIDIYILPTIPDFMCIMSGWGRLQMLPRDTVFLHRWLHAIGSVYMCIKFNHDKSELICFDYSSQFLLWPLILYIIPFTFPHAHTVGYLGVTLN